MPKRRKKLPSASPDHCWFVWVDFIDHRISNQIKSLVRKENIVWFRNGGLDRIVEHLHRIVTVKSS